MTKGEWNLLNSKAYAEKQQEKDDNGSNDDEHRKELRSC